MKGNGDGLDVESLLTNILYIFSNTFIDLNTQEIKPGLRTLNSSKIKFSALEIKASDTTSYQTLRIFHMSPMSLR